MTSRGKPRLGLSVLLDADLRDAQLPLFEAGEVEAIEVAVEHGADAPAWWTSLADFYASEGALYGHGVTLSPFSAERDDRTRRWLEGLRAEARRRSYSHISEHFGFMTLPGVARGAPLPVPFTKTALQLGRDCFARMSDEAGAPVGVENLALAMSKDDALAHGDFLAELVEPSGGFVLLDLHNLHCQAVNFRLDPEDLVCRMPLHLVREIHVSGGSTQGGLRRDTHDGPVPEEVFSLLTLALQRCDDLRCVFMERLGDTFRTEADKESYRADFRRLRTIIDAPAPDPTTVPARERRSPLEDEDAQARDLAALQRALLETLPAAPSANDAVTEVRGRPLASGHDAWVATFDPRAVDIAIAIAKRWIVVEG